MLDNTRYAVSVWLTHKADNESLQGYIEGNSAGTFAQESKLGNLQTDFVEAIFFTNPALIFDAIDKVSYGKYFRSECVKMLYPQQFASYNSLIIVYGRIDAGDSVNAEIFEDESLPQSGELKYIGLIPFTRDSE